MRVGRYSGLCGLIFSGFLMGVPSFAGPLDAGNAAFLQQDYAEALKQFTVAFQDGNAEAGYYMARMFELGLGSPADKPAALRLYQQAAEGGHIGAINRVALMHYRGEEGVVQDYNEAFVLFQEAAKAGDKNAIFNLGKMYFEGQGTNKDTKKALELYQKAADKDHILALNTLGGLHKAENKAEKARTFYKRSADFGNAVGLFETGAFILQDGAEPEHLRAAHMHFNLASARGHPGAAEALQELTALMTLEDINQAQEAAKAFKALLVSED